MPYLKGRRDQTIHVKLHGDELTEIERKAMRVGLSRAAFVRQMALEGKVKGYNMKPLLDHSVAVGEVAAAVREMIALPHPDRWAYEADLERLEDLLQDLIDSEKALLATMTRRLER